MKKLLHSDTGERGWFIGDFAQAAIRTTDFKACWQQNAAGVKEIPHYHKVTTEVQLLTRGRMIVNGVEFGPGDICIIEPGDHYYGEYLEDTEVFAIKFPSVPTDKYYI